MKALLKTEKNMCFSRPAVFRCLGVPKLKRVDARSGLYGVIDCRNLSF
jgi:hypothetical protein